MRYLVLLVPFLALSSPLLSQSVSCTTVQRTQTATCTASGGTHYTNWTFTGADGGTVTRTATIDSPIWSGVVVQSGQVSVTITTASGTNTKRAFLIVSARPVSSFLLTASVPAQQTPGYTCVSDDTSIALQLPSPPSMSGTGDNVLGKYCDIEGYSFQIARIIDSGPNAGYRYIASLTSQTQFHWVYSNDLSNTGSDFYKAQCGNYNASTNPSGYISGTQLATNTIHHESGTTTSHYAEWVSLLGNTSINPGNTFESAAFLVASDTAFSNKVNTNASPSIATINASTMQEPCPDGKGVNDDASCTFRGFVNYADSNGNYATCNP